MKGKIKQEKKFRLTSFLTESEFKWVKKQAYQEDITRTEIIRDLIIKAMAK